MEKDIDPELLRAIRRYQRRTREKDPEVLEARRRYQREYQRRWRAEHPDKWAAILSRFYRKKCEEEGKE